MKVNEYFDGKVTSIALENKEGSSTVGVISAGEFEFGTTTVEYMTIVSGTLEVQLPGGESWEIYQKGETFVVEKDQRFKVRTEQPVGYLCIYK